MISNIYNKFIRYFLKKKKNNDRKKQRTNLIIQPMLVESLLLAYQQMVPCFSLYLHIFDIFELNNNKQNEEKQRKNHVYFVAFDSKLQ